MILRLGLRLTLRGGREGMVRLGVITSAVALAVALLLSVLSTFHAFTVTNDRGCWECTTGAAIGTPAPVAGSAAEADAELWNYTVDYYRGQKIERLDEAVLGSRAPVVPGLASMPGAGQYAVSPAMAALLASAPADELGDRYPGTRVGLIGTAALSSPDELVIISGYQPAQLLALPATTVVTALATKPAVNTTATGYTYGFGVIAIAMFIPLLILISMATRLAAARRDERYAAMRLVGGTTRQISVIAAVDAVVGAVLGAVIGAGLFLAVQPQVAKLALTGARYFPAQVTPTAAGYVAVLVGVPLVSLLGALRSLRAVRIDPMGVVRKTRTRRALSWPALLLPIGLVLFQIHVGSGNFTLVFAGLVLVFAGLISCGGWLTGMAARLIVWSAHRPGTLLAGRRLLDNPRVAFRSVSGLVVAVFIGTAAAGVVPALVSNQVHAGGGTLTDVMRTSFTSQLSLGLTPAQGDRAVAQLEAVPDVTVLPMYAYVTPGTPIQDTIACGYGGGCTSGALVVTCAALAHFPAFGACPPGTGPDAEGSFAEALLTDNMLDIDNHLPVIDGSSRTGTVAISQAYLGAVLVESDRPDSLERARTLLTGYARQTGASDSPETFGEVAQTRAVLFNEAQRITLVAVALTLLVAGVSLAVAVAGGMVERKRPFTLLRLTGVPLSALYRLALLEALVPLVIAGAVAVVSGMAVAGPVVKQLAAKSAAVLVLPGQSYLVTAGAGLAAALLVLVATLPVLGRITRPQDARFE
jgi:hypothetical protein